MSNLRLSGLEIKKCYLDLFTISPYPVFMLNLPQARCAYLCVPAPQVCCPIFCNVSSVT